MTGRRDNQVAGFANCHEITHHFRVRHRYWTAGLDLDLEFRHHRTVRGKDVAETHRNHTHRRLATIAVVSSAAVGVKCLAVHFGESLGRTEHRYWVNRLVGRDHDHRRGSGITRGI